MAERNRTTEDKLWDRLRAQWQLVCPHLHTQRIESTSTGSGIPDVNVCCDGVEFWVELKIMEGKSIRYQKFQPGWLLKRWNSGGLCYTLAQWNDTILIYRGKDALHLAKGDAFSAEPIYKQSDPQDYKLMMEIMRRGRA